MNKTKHLGIGLAGLVAGLAMVAFAFAAGTGGNAQAQTPGATGTAVTTGTSVSGTATSGTVTSGTPTAVGTRTSALTPSASGTPAAASNLPTTGTGPSGSDSLPLWAILAGIALLGAGAAVTVTGARRR